MKYSYRAVDNHDNVIEGTETAADFQQLLRALYAKRLYPLEVRQLSSVAVKTEDHIQHLKKLKGQLSNEPKPAAPEQAPIATPAPKPVVWLRFRIWDWALFILLALCCLSMILFGSAPQK